MNGQPTLKTNAMSAEYAYSEIPHLFGLIGYPLGHSFSQRYFREKFEREGLSQYDYGLFPLSEIGQFPVLLETYPNLEGLNVTIPYKEQVLDYLDDLDSEAASIGAVNVIKVDSGKTIGYNSDIAGFAQSLNDFIGEAKEGMTQALVLGTGGASKAVLHVLRRMGIASITVSRSTGKADLVYADLQKDLIQAIPLIINTTPLGMSPRTEEAPELPYQWLHEGHFLYDLVYNPLETQFMKLGKTQGAHVCNGLDMLYGQAERAWEIWMNK